jgi:PIN domain nuclease of toxin-antitoxin system
VVLDASAALALILNEPGGNRVMALIQAQQIPIAMSSANWCETLTRLQRDSPIMDAKKLASMLPGVEVVPFSRAEAELAAELAKRSGALSLGDRACLALAITRKARAWTTDKMWSSLKLPVRVEFLR